MSRTRPTFHGLLAEFPSEAALAAAIGMIRDAGYRDIDAYSPHPSEDLDEALGGPKSKVALVILVCGILGGAAGYWLQYWVSVDVYPLNVGGRPLHSWPAFIPPTFECTVLAASFGALIGMLLLSGLPRPHHPLFEIPQFAERASRDSFFLSVDADDPFFDRATTTALLSSLGATEVWDVVA